MRNLFYPALLLLACFGCQGPQINHVARVKLQQLAEDDIYNSDRVRDVLFDAGEMNADSLRNSSRLLFLEGIDNFKNKHSPVKAIGFFKRSILCLPDAKTYYELGNALLKTADSEEDIKETVKAYGLAEDLNFQPRSLIYYKKACAYIHPQKTDSDLVVYYLGQAFEQGFNDTLALMNDRRMSAFFSGDKYKVRLRQLLAQRSHDKPEGLFELYKSSFPLVDGTLEILPEQVSMSDHNRSISYDFAKFIPEMESSSFGRNVSNDFIFIARVAETPAYTALLYSSISYFGDQMQPVYTKLVTYGPQGEIIAAKLFSGQFSAERIKTGRFDKGRLTIKDYRRVWTQPIDKVPFEQNAVKSYDLEATATFKIDDSGKILEESVPDNFKDTVILAKNDSK